MTGSAGPCRDARKRRSPAGNWDADDGVSLLGMYKRDLVTEFLKWHTTNGK